MDDYFQAPNMVLSLGYALTACGLLGALFGWFSWRRAWIGEKCLYGFLFGGAALAGFGVFLLFSK